MEVNKIFFESCIDTMNRMADNFIDVTVTSPPYNVGIEYDGVDDKIPFADYTQFTLEWLTLLLAKTKVGGRICLNVPNIMFNYEKGTTMSGLHFFCEMAERSGWIYRENITWIKMKDETGDIFAGGKTAWGSWLSASNPQFRSFTEHIVVFHKDVPRKEPVGESDITKDEFLSFTKNTWYIMPDKDNIHPAVFPKDIPFRCIKIFSYVGDLIYDPFTGSGTTIDACKMLKRNYLGSELSEKYYHYIQTRLSQTEMF